MKAISIMQPWAFAILRLGKRIENRTWAPGGSLLGKVVAIHASKKEDRYASSRIEKYYPGRGPGSFSAILGVARIVDVVRNLETATRLGQEAWWSEQPGNVAHLLEDVRELSEPITGVKGALGYWTVPVDIQIQIELQLSRR